jgi:hypothetical protein
MREIEQLMCHDETNENRALIQQLNASGSAIMLFVGQNLPLFVPLKLTASLCAAVGDRREVEKQADRIAEIV